MSERKDVRCTAKEKRQGNPIKLPAGLVPTLQNSDSLRSIHGGRSV